jgi:hypothetical protein
MYRPTGFRVADVKLTLVQIQGHGVGRVGLNLQRMGPCFRCGLDDFQRTFK